MKGKKHPITKSDIDKLSIYTWVKDTKFRFMSCSENLSELAGEDSPSNMIGKDDFSLIWQSLAYHTELSKSIRKKSKENCSVHINMKYIQW